MLHWHGRPRSIILFELLCWGFCSIHNPFGTLHRKKQLLRLRHCKDLICWPKFTCSYWVSFWGRKIDKTVYIRWWIKCLRTISLFYWRWWSHAPTWFGFPSKYNLLRFRDYHESVFLQAKRVTCTWQSCLGCINCHCVRLHYINNIWWRIDWRMEKVSFRWPRLSAILTRNVTKSTSP